MKNAINWFAIPSADLQRAVKFYNAIFGFQLNVMKMGKEDMAFFPIEQGGVGGHIYIHKDFKPAGDGVIIFLNGGDNLQEILDRVESSGGKIVTSKTQISPEVGYMCFFADSEGNKIALHSPN
ncbi:MAG: VOC family protein [bacterium]